MTDSDEQSSADLPVEAGQNPLYADLDPLQILLLETIFWVVCDRNPRTGWPVWDYVSREVCRRQSEFVDAAAVLRSLPQVPWPGRGTQYGLVWRRGNGGDTPLPGDVVGLTIAGLMALAVKSERAQVMADELSRVIRRQAQRELKLESNPTTPADSTVPLEGPFITNGPYEVPGSQRLLMPVFEDNVVFELLQQEYAILNINISTNPDVGARLNLGPWLRRFQQVESASDYLNIIASDQQIQRPAPQLRPEELALMMDHTSFVLKSHPGWDGQTMASPPDYQTATALATSAANSEEFQARLSDLWTILGRLHIPSVGITKAKAQEGSLARLKGWLTQHLLDETSRDRAREAVEDIRSVGPLRAYAQHPSAETRQNAANACSRLGLEFPIREYPVAWDLIRARVAQAFLTISQETRS